MLIMFQWIRISSLQQDEVSIGCNRRSGPPPSIDSFASALNLPLSDLLIFLADLITSVPGLVTCIQSMTYSPAYLVAALLARQRDGRRRTMKE
jgi:hypothetical protein